MMKKIKAFITAVAICGTAIMPCTSAFAQTEKGVGAAVRGDVNRDGALTVADVVVVQKWLLNYDIAVMSDLKNADLCADGVIDVYDLCMMKKELVSTVDSGYVSPQIDAENIEMLTVYKYNKWCWRDAYEYTSPEKISALADYFNGLHLSSNYTDDPDECSGAPWYVTIDLKDGGRKTIAMFDDMFYREGSGKCLKMDSSEAAAFAELIDADTADSFIKDPFYGAQFGAAWIYSYSHNEDRHEYDHGATITKSYDAKQSVNVPVRAEIISAEGVEPLGEPVCVKNGCVTFIDISFTVNDDCAPGKLVYELIDGEDHRTTKTIHCWHEDEHDYVTNLTLDSLADECFGVRDYFWYILYGEHLEKD